MPRPSFHVRQSADDPQLARLQAAREVVESWETGGRTEHSPPPGAAAMHLLERGDHRSRSDPASSSAWRASRIALRLLGIRHEGDRIAHVRCGLGPDRLARSGKLPHAPQVGEPSCALLPEADAAPSMIPGAPPGGFPRLPTVPGHARSLIHRPRRLRPARRAQPRDLASVRVVERVGGGGRPGPSRARAWRSEHRFEHGALRRVVLGKALRAVLRPFMIPPGRGSRRMPNAQDRPSGASATARSEASGRSVASASDAACVASGVAILVGAPCPRTRGGADEPRGLVAVRAAATMASCAANSRTAVRTHLSGFPPPFTNATSVSVVVLFATRSSAGAESSARMASAFGSSSLTRARPPLGRDGTGRTGRDRTMRAGGRPRGRLAYGSRRKALYSSP